MSAPPRRHGNFSYRRGFSDSFTSSSTAGSSKFNINGTGSQFTRGCRRGYQNTNSFTHIPHMGVHNSRAHCKRIGSRTLSSSGGRGRRNLYTTRNYADAFADELPGLVSRDPDEVITILSSKERSFEELLSSEYWNSEADKLPTLIQILGEKLCGPSNLLMQRNQLVAKCCRPSFLDQLTNFTVRLSEDQQLHQLSSLSISGESANRQQGDGGFTLIVLDNVHSFCKFVNEKMPNQIPEKFLALATTVTLVISALKTNPSCRNKLNELDDLKEKFEKLKHSIQQYKMKRDEAMNCSTGASSAYRMRQLNAVDRLWKEAPPNDFRSIPVVPTPEELLSDQKVFLRPSLTKGKYPSAQDYLDVQYRLLREDFVAPLRKGIQDYFLIKDGRKQMSPGSVKVYLNCQLFPRLNFDRNTPYYVMRLDYGNSRYLRKVKWDKSKRLLTGSLLLLTNDNFETVYFATICKREVQELEREGIFGIKWEASKPEFSAESYFDVLECDVYFETYRHTLTALKGIELEGFPMAKYIVDADIALRSPSYIQKIDKPVNFRMLMPNINKEDEIFAGNYGLADIREICTWPTAYELGMDPSQYRAFCAAITREISIIQGPPGTGKTFIGIQIAKFLLVNKKYFFPEEKKEIETLSENSNEARYEKSYDGRPVLVVCYTNHALDQFLEAIIAVMEELGINPNDQLIRVGGQTKSDVMKQLVLYERLNVAQHTGRLPRDFELNLNNHKRLLRVTRGRRFTLIDCLKGLKESTGILDLKNLPEIGESFNAPETKFLDMLRDAAHRRKIKPRNNEDFLEYCFGLTGNYFYNFNFKSSNWITYIFGSRFDNREKFNVASDLSPPVQFEPKEKSEEDDDENYDLEELMANRIQEIEYEIDIKGLDERKYQPVLLIDPNGNPMQEYFLKCLRKDLDSKMIDDKTLQELTDHFENQVRRVSKQYLVIKEIIRMYQEDRLTLLEVKHDELGSLCNAMNEQTKISPLMVWSIYFHLLEKCKKEVLKTIIKLEEDLVNMDKEHKEVENSCYSLLLKNAKFVGMTTTGAAKNNSLLPMMKSRMVIVEEAAEVLESHVVTSITQHCEHLILIGDHKQLRPKTAVYELTSQKGFNLDISLFERMINNDLNLYRLDVQHRMRPDICELIVPTIYDSLQNHESVLDYPLVLGVESNLFFISHKELETDEADSTSKSNLHEAKFLVRLCRHLRLQGYGADRITIITTYIGQMFLIKKMIWKEEICHGVRVTVVDNFQGEENDIILLSLVRSNEESNIGFLKTENRICVALSRAKHGFYVIGNMDSMVTSSLIWEEIVVTLKRKNNIGPQLSLKCQIHDDIFSVTCAEDFDKAPEGGCSKMCETRLERCGHICPLVCHIMDKNHIEYKCRFPCLKSCEKYAHPCRFDCFEICPRCTVRVDTLLVCGHSEKLFCYINESTYRCTTQVVKPLLCGHELQMPCHQDTVGVKCQQIVKRLLPCNHEQDAACFQQPEDIACKSKINVIIPSCKHSLEIVCSLRNLPDEWTCTQPCDTRLNCGHACTRKCHPNTDPNHESYRCQKECARSCPNGHKCRGEFGHNHKCHSKCPDCKIKVSKVITCGHEATIYCHHSQDEDYIANLSCFVEVSKKSINCSHDVLVSCSEIAAKFRCKALVVSKSESPCGHVVEIPCNVEDKINPDELLSYCQAPCGAELSEDGVGCKHLCTGSCSECFRGRLHKKCQRKCGRVLICGHVCKYKCSIICPPCKAICELKCQHSKCKRRCGVPCTTCKEPCSWICVHKKCSKLCGKPCNRDLCDEPCLLELRCGHSCVGLCGTPCPPLCRICDKAELTELFFGDEDNPDARYVYLVDCKHTFEVNGLDKWMRGGSDANQGLQVKKCPRCSTTVQTSIRYGQLLKSAYADVIKVKRRIFGNETKTFIELTRLAEKFEKQLSMIDQVNSIQFFAKYLSEEIYTVQTNPFNTTNQSGNAELGRYTNSRNRKPQYRFNESIDQYVLESLTNLVAWWEEACMTLRPNYINNLPLPRQIKPVSSGYFQRIGQNLDRRLLQQNAPVAIPNAQLVQHESEIVKNPISQKCLEDLEKRYVGLLTTLTNRNLPLSHLEIKQFSMELNRLADLFQLFRRYSVDDFKLLKLEWRCEEVKKTLLKFPVYNKAAQLNFEEQLKEIDRLMKQSLPVVRRAAVEAIYHAVGYSGSWYKCRNGHIYTIGDCGQPNGTGFCADCKVPIGAGSGFHIPAIGNLRIAEPSHAPPFDLIPMPDFLQ